MRGCWIWIGRTRTRLIDWGWWIGLSISLMILLITLWGNLAIRRIKLIIISIWYAWNEVEWLDQGADQVGGQEDGGDAAEEHVYQVCPLPGADRPFRCNRGISDIQVDEMREMICDWRYAPIIFNCLVIMYLNKNHRITMFNTFFKKEKNERERGRE